MARTDGENPRGPMDVDYGAMLIAHRAPVDLLDRIPDEVDHARRMPRGLSAPTWAIAATFLATFFLGTTVGLLLGHRTAPSSSLAQTVPQAGAQMPGAIPASATIAVGGAAQRATLPVRLVLHAPQASQVSVAGSWNDWNPKANNLVPLGEGTFSTVLRLEPGTHEYMFVVDGSSWVPDPSAPLSRDDGFGSRNSVLEI